MNLDNALVRVEDEFVIYNKIKQNYSSKDVWNNFCKFSNFILFANIIENIICFNNYENKKKLCVFRIYGLNFTKKEIYLINNTKLPALPVEW